MSSSPVAFGRNGLYSRCTMTSFADRLTNAIREKRAPVCVGLDPLIERIPPSVLRDAGDLDPADISDGAGSTLDACVAALSSYGRAVIDTVAPLVPAIKINIAFFERYFAEGVAAYFELIRHAQDAGLLVIGDAKRADIGHTSNQYALGHLADSKRTGAGVADALTINPYFGFDSIRPFLERAGETQRGLFVLVQTSNESAAEVQGLALSDGTLVCQRVAELVQRWASGEGLIGQSGYSAVGAVVSPRDLESTERIRSLMPNCLFLVPGFGAQGRTAEEVARCFKPDGTGAIINASRSVIYAHQVDRYREHCGDDWRQCVALACQDLIDAIRRILPA